LNLELINENTTYKDVKNMIKNHKFYHLIESKTERKNAINEFLENTKKMRLE